MMARFWSRKRQVSLSLGIMPGLQCSITLSLCSTHLQDTVCIRWQWVQRCALTTGGYVRNLIVWAMCHSCWDRYVYIFDKVTSNWRLIILYKKHISFNSMFVNFAYWWNKHDWTHAIGYIVLMLMMKYSGIHNFVDCVLHVFVC